jgi:hypothetical protein
MSPLFLFALAGIGGAIALASSRDMGLRFIDECTGAVVHRATKARETITTFARDAGYASPIQALDAWITAVGGQGAVGCFGLDNNMLPAPFPGVSVPNLPTRGTAALYLLYLDYMIDTFVEVRPGFDTSQSVDIWNAVADRFQLTPADVNAVPIEWIGN